jgi:AraC-like DNA-binding protein
MRYAAFAGSGFHILMRGEGWLITAAGQPRELKPGDVVMTPSGAGHGLSHAPCRLESLSPAVMNAEPPGSGPAAVEFLCGAYWLRYGQLPNYLSQLPEVIVVSPEYERYPSLGSLAGLLGMDVSGPQLGAEVTRSALLDLFLTHVLRQWLEQNRDADRPEIYDPVVGAALREIHASPDRPWTVQQLSEAAGLSRTAFTKRFSALVGKPPMAYLTGWRLARAARLLRETSAPLAVIARQVGYSTEFAFGGAFRREYGISPGRFRQLDIPAPIPASHRNSSLETKEKIPEKAKNKTGAAPPR